MRMRNLKNVTFAKNLDMNHWNPCDIGGSERDKWKWFENCIGALDGTHIPVIVSAEDRPRYRNRKVDISTNVLGVCDPDLKFIYVLSRWEGFKSDSRVLKDALARDNSFQVPSDKYYLVDAGYANGLGSLAPDRGTRYYLNEWIGNNHPENYKELFNLRHSIARNVIESCPKRRNQKPSDIPPPKKRGTTNVLADSVAKMASSLEHFINSTTQKLDPTKVYNEVIAIPDLSPDEQLKACSWFIENEKQFLMLKTIPTKRKKGMVFMFISPKA
ncbi:PREDICTED: ALP1 [Prunus dulcis]|uniref:PREDICTED: ALP1 n=1 Tax=Prunus dulcis TaxID=3755 RepID=A0A5E4GJ96_PRUDU|nr:PREDICTED: ALP1 [Prunus dulcis]